MAKHSIDDLLQLMARLRDPDEGCPWDCAQTFASIAPYTIEEAYEVAEAIAAEDMPALKDELGDLLFQVVFHARMAEEAGHFAFADVVEAIINKMERRHPHVFADAVIGSAEEQVLAWEALKAAEKGGKPKSALDGVSHALPALLRAEKLQRRASRVGFDWRDINGPLEKISEELDEVKDALQRGEQRDIEAEIGDLLFAVVNVARFAKVNPETAVTGCNQRFTKRFHLVEAQAAAQGLDLTALSAAELETLWEAAKAQLRNKPV